MLILNTLKKYSIKLIIILLISILILLISLIGNHSANAQGCKPSDDILNINCQDLNSFNLKFLGSIDNIKLAENEGQEDTCPDSEKDADGNCPEDACPDSEKDADGNCPESPQNSCNIEGVGWFVCPILSAVSFVTDAAYSQIAKYLVFDASILDDQNLKNIWEIFRNIANVLFVIVFIFIIYSQITGLGITNYGIKRLLPKLFIAAVLVNTSYWICAIAVDLSNIFGASLKSIFDNVQFTANGSGSGSVLQKIGERVTWGGIIVTAVAAGLGIILAISGPVLLAVFLILVSIFFILFLRQALIILLIVVAPVAFVLYLLPNTNKWFSKWIKLFGSLLLLYPIISILFGVGALAGNLLVNTAASDDAENGNYIQLAALGIASAPLIATPALLKGALDATGSFGGKIGNLSSRALKRGNESIKGSRFGEAMANQKRNRSQRRLRRRLGGVQSKFDNSRLGKKIIGERGVAAAVNEEARLKNEDIEAQIALFQQKNRDPATTISKARDSLKESMVGSSPDDIIKARAMQKILLGSGASGLKALDEVYEDTNTPISQEASNALRSDIVSSGVKGKDAALDSWSLDPKQSLTKHASQVKTFTRLNESEVSTQIPLSLARFRDAVAIEADQEQFNNAQGLAVRTLDQHEKGTVQLSSDQIKYLEEIKSFKYKPPTSTGGPGSPPNNPPTTGSPLPPTGGPGSPPNNP